MVRLLDGCGRGNVNHPAILAIKRLCRACRGIEAPIDHWDVAPEPGGFGQSKRYLRT